MTYTVGIDIGSGAVKTVLFNDNQWLAKRVERIRRRDPMELARQGFDEVRQEKNLAEKDISYIATTGEGENVKFATGHFYSRTSKNPEKVSSICAVLAETDVINMVSRGIATPDILKGIHISMASRLVKLLKVTGITKGTVLLTGGLALDVGLLAALQEELVNEKISGLTATSHPDSIYAGAIGAALWGAYRHNKLRELQARIAA